jgi:hypothetical protein
MKLKALAVGCLVTLAATVAFADPGDVVEPASTNLVNARSDANNESLGGTYVVGSTLLLTNCYCFDADGNTQGLDNVTVEITIGTTSSNNVYTGTVYAVGVDTNFWYLSLEVPDVSPSTLQLQTKLEDENTNIYYYPLKRVGYRDAL